MTSSDFNFLKELNCKSEESGAEEAKEDPGEDYDSTLKKLSEALRRTKTLFCLRLDGPVSKAQYA